MQKILNLPKYLFLAVLSLSLLIPYDAGNIDMIGLGNTYDTANDSSIADIFLSGRPYTPVPPGDVSNADTIWSTMSSEFTLDHQVQTPAVQKELRKILAERNKLYSILKAAAPYIYFIHQQTKTRGLPAELTLIPVIESEFNPNDHSKKGALGLWQLMRGTANELGVKVKAGYDGRRDVIASTNAALAYFNDLGNFFNGNWYLAIAAYNCGQGKIQSAVRRAGSRSFWNLRLPQETKQYVPKLLAVAEIVKNPEKYNVQLPPVSNQPYFTTLKVNKPLNLVKVAKTTGVNVQTLHTLNPDYKHTPLPKKGNYSLLVPLNAELRVRAKLADKIVA